MRIARDLAGRWNAWWFAETDPHPLAAFRILFGIYLFCYFVEMLPHVTLMFSNQGVYVPFLIPDVAPPPMLAWALYLGLLGAVVAVTLGVHTQVTTPLLLGGYAYFYFLNLAVKNTAYDRLNLIFLGILCLAPAGTTWSLSAASKNESSRTASTWAARLIAAQVALLYFGAGLWKLSSPAWHESDMMRMTLVGPWGTPLAFDAVAVMPSAIYPAINWSVMLIEIAMPVLLFIRVTRPFAFAAGLAFHAGNWIFLGLPEFMNVVTTYVLFMEPASVRVAGDRLILAVSRRLAGMATGAVSAEVVVAGDRRPQHAVTAGSRAAAPQLRVVAKGR